jgi:hypothetical protein
MDELSFPISGRTASLNPFPSVSLIFHNHSPALRIYVTNAHRSEGLMSYRVREIWSNTWRKFCPEVDVGHLLCRVQLNLGESRASCDSRLVG